MNILFQIIVFFLKLFSLPYRITKMLFSREKLDEQDAETLLDVLSNWKDEDE